MFSTFASLPSPSSGSLDLGPFRLHVYRLMIALGVLAAARLAVSGAGTRDDMSSIAVWGVIGGVVGARLYHVVTDWSAFSDDLGRIPLIWKGGLGIPGGLLGGISAGLWVAHRKGISLAQGIVAAAYGLYGLPTTVLVSADGIVVAALTGAVTEDRLLALIHDRLGITPD